MHGHSILNWGHAVARGLLLVHGARDVGTVLLRGTHHGHLAPVRVIAAVKKIPIFGHVVHAVLDGNHAEGVDHVVSRDVTKPVQVVQVTVVTKTSNLLGLGILLNTSLRVGQVAGSGGVPTTDRALLEVTLQDIASRKRIVAKHTHVGAVAGVYKRKKKICVSRLMGK